MSPHPKPKPPLRSPKYLAWLREKPCEVCGRPGPCHAAHMSILDAAGNRKASDKYAIPACFDCHMIGEHTRGILTMWNERSGLKFENKHDLRDHLFLRCEEYYDEYNRS